MSKALKIGTRASKLAMWQAELVQSKLEAAGLTTELVPFETKGDKILNVSLSKIGSKGVFTEELEEALRTGDIHIAVHSAKDMQSSLPDDLPILAFMEREEAFDVVVSLSPDVKLGDDIVVGTSSTRRRALLRHIYPDIKLAEMRGNLQTRFAKMEKGDCDAMILAYAGVHRMGYNDNIVQKLDSKEFTSPVGQGSIAIQGSLSLEDDTKEIIVSTLNHTPTASCLEAERALLKKLDGGCSVPIFGHATLDGDTITLNAGIASLDGKTMLRESAQGPKDQPVALGDDVAEKLIEQGAKELLDNIRRNL